jgi:Transposase
MIIIGADYHPGFQQIAFVDTDTGEFQERRLQHREEAEKFYRDLAAQGMKVGVGMEASGHARWFERLLSELHFELRIGDAAEIRTKRVRKQKTDRQDAQLILQLMLEDRFPQIWVPSWENRDLRQLLWHRHRMVQARTRIMNQLQAVALNEGLRCKKRLWRDAGREQLESFALAPWASRRRRELLELLDQLTPTIAELTQAIEKEVEKCPEAQRLQTHPGVGALTALAFVLIIGPSRSVSVWQADRELSGTGAVGGFQRTAATAGTHHETRQLAVALPAGGSGASHGAQRPGMAQQVFSPDHAARTQDREGSHGPQTRRSSVLDVAQGMELRAVEKVRFARGTTRKSPWCAVEHRVIDWGSRSPSRGSSK